MRHSVYMANVISCCFSETVTIIVAGAIYMQSNYVSHVSKMMTTQRIA